MGVAEEMAKEKGLENPISDMLGAWQDNVANYF